MVNRIEISKFNSTAINPKDSKDNLYYIISKEKNFTELHKLNFKTGIDSKIASHQHILNYFISEDYIFVNIGGVELEIIDINTNKSKQVFTSGGLFDYKNGEFYFYKEIEENKICLYKTKEDFKFEDKCDMKVTFNPKKEIFKEYPIKLEKNTYALYFGKLEKEPVRYEGYSVFGVPLYRRPTLYYEHSEKGYYLIVDVKKNKILYKIAN